MQPVLFIFETDCTVAGSFLIVMKNHFLSWWGGGEHNDSSLLFCVMGYAINVGRVAHSV